MTMHIDEIQHVAAEWIAAKAEEQAAVERRRKLEDTLTDALGINPAEEGQITFNVHGYAIKTTRRLNHKIDGERLQELAEAAGIGHDVLRGLFRWKAELSAREWRAAVPAITSALADAITTTAGRPSYSITKDEE